MLRKPLLYYILSLICVKPYLLKEIGIRSTHVNNLLFYD